MQTSASEFWYNAHGSGGESCTFPLHFVVHTSLLDVLSIVLKYCNTLLCLLFDIDVVSNY